MLLSLTIICVSAGAILATVNEITSGPIAVSRAAALNDAIRKVAPDYDNNPSEEYYKAATPEGDSLLIYPAMKDGKQVGAAVESFSTNGFSGLIRIIVGFDNEGNILDYSVLHHTETPGLGSKMQEWFHTEKNQQCIIGRSMEDGYLSVTKDGGDVDAITASTITSRAFLEAVNKAYKAYKEKTDATTGASPDAEKAENETSKEEGENNE